MKQQSTKGLSIKDQDDGCNGQKDKDHIMQIPKVQTLRWLETPNSYPLLSNYFHTLCFQMILAELIIIIDFASLEY